MHSGSELVRCRLVSIGEISLSLLAGGISGNLSFLDGENEFVNQGSADEFAELRLQHLWLLHRVRSSTAELLTTKRRYGKLLAAVSHELRSPLAAIRYGIQLMHIQNVEPEVRQKASMRIERQVDRMARLINDLLQVSQIDHSLCLERERIDLRGVVQQAIDTTEPSVTEHHHRLIVEMPEAPVWIAGDRGRLEQVFVNLLVNAAKYTGRGGELRLVMQQESSQAIVRIRDSGIGIAPEKLPDLFDLFMQVDRSPRHSESGLGIGLALVRSLVEAHGGRVNAASAGLGQGSEFTVFLPSV